MRVPTVILFLLFSITLEGQELAVKTDTTKIWSYANIPWDSLYIDTVYTHVCTSSIGLIDNGKRHGTWNFNFCDKKFSANNSKFQTPIATVDFIDGQPTGKFISYYRDSTIKSEFHFQNGQIDGKFTCKNEEGITVYQGTVDRSQNTVTGKEFNSTGSFKRNRKFMIETLRRDWINKIE